MVTNKQHHSTARFMHLVVIVLVACRCTEINAADGKLMQVRMGKLAPGKWGLLVPQVCDVSHGYCDGGA